MTFLSKNQDGHYSHSSFLPPPKLYGYINVKTISVGLGMGDLDKSIGRYLVGSDVG